MTRIATLLIACLLGCSSAHLSDAKAPESPMLLDIQLVIAEQLRKNPGDVKPELTFAALGADDLDLVEITMEVEDRFEIAISDDSLVTASGASDVNALCNHLTVRAFAAVAEESPKSPLRDPPSNTIVGGNLRESQVGTFAELSHLPNPTGLVLVFIPSLEELTQLHEQRLGRKMDDVEIDTLRQKAAVIALPAEVAEKLKQQE